MFRHIITIVITACLFMGCSNKPQNEYTYAAPGYFFKLLAFKGEAAPSRKGNVAHLSASFKTQKDSVFWDTFNNVNDLFFVPVDSTVDSNFFHKQVSLSTEQDSLELLIATAKFYKQQYGLGYIPYFSEKDSVVKVNYRIKKVMTPSEFEILKTDLQKKETALIEAFFGDPQAFENARHALGFYWVNKPLGESKGEPIKQGENITVRYAGSFLNGRFLESSGGYFEITYGTPDQVLKGLNYVIGQIKVGQNAKIILPSRLAFGENGSSNGTVPPYTPLLYEIEIKNR